MQNENMIANIQRSKTHWAKHTRVYDKSLRVNEMLQTLSVDMAKLPASWDDPGAQGRARTRSTGSNQGREPPVGGMATANADEDEDGARSEEGKAGAAAVAATAVAAAAARSSRRRASAWH